MTNCAFLTGDVSAQFGEEAGVRRQNAIVTSRILREFLVSIDIFQAKGTKSVHVLPDYRQTSNKHPGRLFFQPLKNWEYFLTY